MAWYKGVWQGSSLTLGWRRSRWDLGLQEHSCSLSFLHWGSGCDALVLSRRGGAIDMSRDSGSSELERASSGRCVVAVRLQTAPVRGPTANGSTSCTPKGLSLKGLSLGGI